MNLEQALAIELSLMSVVAMRDLNGRFIQVGQFTTSLGTFNFIYYRDLKKGTYRNAQKPNSNSVFNDNANMFFDCENIGDRLIVISIR